ncbi:hypothetical protein NDU88_003717 [Pleurodeles waltl]|uniref:Uncharacterized protein n=1 Tax=Pleurodeles waltl TaxID=8319 RepID=A0AAV7TPS4_PLEWA|nr:hypothetical protein NDU88_003717 [Pleurodeles waltl]
MGVFTAPTDSSDWRCSRASEVGDCHPHGNVRAAPDTWDSDFRVPGIENSDDGLEGGSEKSSEATASRGRNRASGGEAPAAEGAKIEKPELLNGRRRREERTSPQETSTFCHVPGGTWLNKSAPVKKWAYKEHQKIETLKKTSHANLKPQVCTKVLNKYHLHLQYVSESFIPPSRPVTVVSEVGC